jgi:putative hydrolase of the HAD superfamily
VRRAYAAVLFDLDDTLHDDTRTYREAARRVAESVARERGVAARDVLAAYIREAETFWATLRAEDLVRSLSAERVRMWGAALRAAGIHDDALAVACAQEYNRARSEGLTLYPGVLELLRDLRAAGCKSGLITNGFAQTHRAKLTLLGLEGAFDAVFIADEVGMIKPDPALFRHACATLGVATEDSVMVGDRYERDIRGAQAAGMSTIWLNRHNEPTAGRSADAIAATFGDVIAALEGTLQREPA